MITRTFPTLTKSLRFAHARPFALFSAEKPLNPSLSKLSTNDQISANVGMNRFLSRVYNTTGLSILGALSTSYAVLSVPVLSAMMMPLAMGGLASTLIGFISAIYMKPQYYTEEEALNNREKISIFKSKNGPLRLAMYGLGTVGLGLSAAPLMAFASAVSPTILPTAIGLTAAIFGGASIIAYRMPKDSMLKFGKALLGSLFGLIGLQLAGLAASFIVGPNPFSMMVFKSSSYMMAVGLFSALIAYDTHFAIKMYELGRADHLGMASQFLLDFWNILTSLLRIFSSD
jgi:FtsH-binding integral membrane protein